MTNAERLMELDRLTAWLNAFKDGYNWKVERADEDWLTGRHIVIVYTADGTRLFDAICHYGSYGYSEGLLEIMGTIVYKDDGDQVVGYLTADDVIERIINVYG